MRKAKLFLLFLLIMQIVVFGGESVNASVKVITYIYKNEDIPVVAERVPGKKENVLEKLEEVSVKAFDSDGNLQELSVEWDFSAVNLSTVGVYTLRGNIQIPTGNILAENVTIPSVQTTVSVQRKGSPEINAYYEDFSKEICVFPWVKYDTPQDMNVWLKKSGEKWENLTGTGMAVCLGDGLQLSKKALVEGNTYSLVVGYGKRMTKTLKFSYGLDKTLNIISYQKEFAGEAEDPSKCISSYNEEAFQFVDRYYAEAMPVGGNMKAMVEMLNEKAVLLASVLENFGQTEETPAVKLNVQWDLSDVNMKVPGVYKVKGKYVLPSGYSIAKDLKLPEPEVYVSVQEEGLPRIDTCYFVNGNIIGFPVLFRGMKQDEFRSVRVYFREIGGEFKDITGKGVTVESTGIYLDTEKYIEDNSSYEIYAEYKNGNTNVYAFTYKELSIIREDTFAKADEEDFDKVDDGDDEPNEEDMNAPEDEENPGEDSSNGDSDDDMEGTADEDESGAGNDYGSGVFNDYHGDSSDSGDSADSSSDDSDTAETSASVIAVTESETDTATIISGKSLNLLMEESGNYVTFEKKGIAVQLSETTLKEWKMEENDGFKISIQQISDKGFSVRVFVNDEEKKEIPGTIVKLPLSDFIEVVAPESVKVTDIDDNICASTYDDVKGVLEVTLKKTGDYFMEDGQENSEKDFLDDEYTEDNNQDDEIPVDEEFWGDEELFPEDEIFENEGLMEDIGDEMFVDDEFEGEVIDDEFIDDELQSEDISETEEKWYEKALAKFFEIIDEMKERGTLIPAAVAVGAVLILIVLASGNKKNKK